MNFKKNKLFSIILPALSAPLILAASCSSSRESNPEQEQKQEKETKVQGKTKNKSNYFIEQKIKFEDKLPYTIANNIDTLKPNFAYEVDKKHSVRDGDTVDFIFLGINRRLPVRFSGVDTPEKRNYNLKQETVGQQREYALKATEFTQKMLNEESVSKIYIVPQKTRGGKGYFADVSGTYGRIIGIVYIEYKDKDNKSKYINLNAELIRLGFALVKYISLSERSQYYTPNTMYYYQLKASEQEAREKKAGIYSDNANLAEIYPNPN
ncbi:nuclease lipoprotein [Mycoplasmopsis californica]|uniref:Nuclease lipoprotein n=1 Tax=Mycoplasmopsis californica TaxID=2113 RepID=A0A059XVV0_9BACT|nr:thermonuclease family protein [Mycoplasmopsis californica]AIA29461.1 nuclease lipoprotein [Mycoplasmopsis californica]